jgi:hypothetical protein
MQTAMGSVISSWMGHVITSWKQTIRILSSAFADVIFSWMQTVRARSTVEMLPPALHYQVSG